MKIQSILNMVGPLTSKEIIDRFISLLSEKGIHWLSDKDMSRIKMLSNYDCEEYLTERLSNYLSTGKIKNIEKPKKPHYHQYRDEHLASSPKEKGYEYGLSDW